MHTAARTREYIRSEDVVRDENANSTGVVVTRMARGLGQSLIFFQEVPSRMADDTASFVAGHSVLAVYCQIVIIIAAAADNDVENNDDDDDDETAMTIASLFSRYAAVFFRRRFYALRGVYNNFICDLALGSDLKGSIRNDDVP